MYPAVKPNASPQNGYGSGIVNETMEVDPSANRTMFSDFQADKQAKAAFENSQFLFSDPQNSVTKLHLKDMNKVP